MPGLLNARAAHAREAAKSVNGAHASLLGATRNRLLHRHNKVENRVDHVIVNTHATDASLIAHDIKKALADRFGAGENWGLAIQ
jgi:hypothetical protein